MKFDTTILSDEDFAIAFAFVGGRLTKPDLLIAPEGEDKPYLYRWHVIDRNNLGNVYFHVQVASDPERPLHDHPWPNMSNILSGGYDELYQPYPEIYTTKHRRSLRKGDTVYRTAQEAHRLILPHEFKYTMTLFSTGPKVRDWGFWYPDGWRPASRVTEIHDGVSIHKENYIFESLKLEK